MDNKLSLGIDVGSSSVKVSLLDIKGGECIASSTNPSDREMPIFVPEKGFAEQDPDMWWNYVKAGIRDVAGKLSGSGPAKDVLSRVACIGITYQMHGLVVTGSDGIPLRKAIIWCDSRAVNLGRKAMEGIGHRKCMEHCLNSPGNFTASKLAWVRVNEPAVYSGIYKAMLPGDYIAFKMSGKFSTTYSGLSEGILWDFKRDEFADMVADELGLDKSLFCEAGPSIASGPEECVSTDAAMESEFGIRKGTPISYRAGDQPNNAFSLNVLDPGEIATTAGTSGVIYGVTDKRNADRLSRVNTFLHVNHTGTDCRYGVLLCINGTGISNSWLKHNILNDSKSYGQMNDLAATVPAGSDGMFVIPFGNGSERILENNMTDAQLCDVDFNRHSTAHIVRAVQEGVAFSFRYGLDIMRESGIKPEVMKAGTANMFLNPVFRTTLATICDTKIELYNTDGALGAARGAALGAGYYSSRQETFASLKKTGTTLPDHSIKSVLDETYLKWKERLHILCNIN
ncbi:MAG: FGGY family carbohydrate kinase [Bacteroidales bacterium]|jgi:xylulokinase|nr:FGGY family carbohydrate kinase [Bacteroidales bacterium]